MRFFKKRRWLLFLVVIPFGTLVLLFGAAEVTSTPSFCGTCHIMVPYVTSWKSSSHKNVSCTKCHFTPGVQNAITAKFQGLSMTVQYFTGTEGPVPWAQVENDSCLRSGCHETRLLEGQVDFRGVRFNHTPHLTGMRRGKELRCASCHSQIVQGTHIAVTESTCFLCHFKEQELGESTANCRLCHDPKSPALQARTAIFNHGDMVNRNVDCLSCHAKVVIGDGYVSPNRCLTCHNEPARLVRIDDQIYLHQQHVTKRKIDCTNCHQEIRHSRKAALSVLPANCKSCHESKHVTTASFYRGAGAEGVADMPAPMYQAQVDCKACHTIRVGETFKASDDSCAKCHGESARKIFGGWKTLAEQSLAVALNEFDAARAQIDPVLPSLKPATRSNVSAILERVRHNLVFVQSSHPTHNIQYANAIFDNAHDQLNLALKEAGRSALANGFSVPPYQIACLQCHTGMQTQTVKAFGKVDFPHGAHILKGKLVCTQCHGKPHQGAEKKLVPGDCSTCHHERTKAGCATCHGAGPANALPVLGKQFSHAKHAANDVACDVCHASPGKKPSPDDLPTLCTTCHPSAGSEGNDEKPGSG